MHIFFLSSKCLENLSYFCQQTPTYSLISQVPREPSEGDPAGGRRLRHVAPGGGAGDLHVSVPQGQDHPGQGEDGAHQGQDDGRGQGNSSG